MTDPLRRLKFLPWRSLIQVSALVTLIVVVLEFLLVLGYEQSPGIRSAIVTLSRPPLGLLLPFAIAVGLGALAVYLLERLHQQVSINTSCLWALVLCLALLLLFKSLVPQIPAILVAFNE
ncbi:MAG: peptide chain release factor 1, partial [Chroococcidiopsidaceae cyanobacterium CP_BM_RX_35]|nr:peptide chain release factor 1 [Chroococcidiopsidaceae cyanobacterium CP_BM_RX_35]